MQNMYIKIDGVEGASTSKQGDKQIELLSFNHGVAMPLSAASPSGTTVKHGRTVHQDFTITKFVDKTSPALNLKCSAGDNIKTCTVSIFQAGESTGDPNLFYKFDLEDCIITSVSVSGGGDLPVETVTLHYNKIKWTFKPQDPSAGSKAGGNVETGWDLEKNAKV